MEMEEGGWLEVLEIRVMVSWKSMVGFDVYWLVYDWFVLVRKQIGVVVVGLESWL